MHDYIWCHYCRLFLCLLFTTQHFLENSQFVFISSTQAMHTRQLIVLSVVMMSLANNKEGNRINIVCFLDQWMWSENGEIVPSKCHIVNLRNLIFWTLERSNYQNQKLKMPGIMSAIDFCHTQHSEIFKICANICTYNMNFICLR